MGKMPVLGMVSFCWLSLALAGCDTTNNTVPRPNKFGGSTFGNNTKDSTISRNASTDGSGQKKSNDPAFVDERTASRVELGAGGSGGSLPEKVGGDTVRPVGLKSPGTAGLVDTNTASMNNTTIPDGRKVTPGSSSYDTLKDRSTLSTSNAPQSSGRPEPPLPPGSTGVALPPPPGSSIQTQLPAAATPGKSLPALSTQDLDEPRPARPVGAVAPTDPATPPPAPAAPGGMKALDPPLPPTLVGPKPANQGQTIYDAPPPPPPPAPPPPAPVPVAPKAGETPAPVIDAPPPASPPGPFVPGSPPK